MEATHNSMRRASVCAGALLLWFVGNGLHAQSSPDERDASSDPDAGAAAIAREPAAPPATYGARARVAEGRLDPTQPTEAESRVLQADLGASFSLAESLPGSLPVFSGVPYLIVRGAPPSGTAVYYDGVQIPALFHVALAPAVINPHLVGEVDFHPGVAPARFGRHVGGSLVAKASSDLDAIPARRELELTLLDASGYLYVPEIDTAFAWRFGDPGLLMNVLGLDATLNYYDYQVRHTSAIGENTRLVLLAFGSGDQLGDRTEPANNISLSTHRWVARIARRIGKTEIGSELVIGYDASTLGRELDGDGERFAPSVFVEHRADSTRLRLGAEMLSTHVSLRRRPADQLDGMVLMRPENFDLNPEDFLDGQPYASVPSRGGGGAYAEFAFRPITEVSIELGTRADLWLAGSDSEFAWSPSGRVSLAVTDDIELHAAGGLSHQAHGSPVPLPGLADIAIDAGLESAIQVEFGASIRLPADMQLEAAYFRNHFLDSVLLELIIDCPGHSDPEIALAVSMGRELTSICNGSGLPTATGTTQGLELYLKRRLTERLTGFVSYTLSFADGVSNDGTKFTPQSDVRHVANAVLRFDLGGGFGLGARIHYRTGKIGINLLPDLRNGGVDRVEQRLPSFFRADLRASYSWNVSFGRMEAMIGVQNITASSEATKRDCLPNQERIINREASPFICTIDYQPAILLPNLGIRAEM